MPALDSAALADLTSEVVAAYVTRNHVKPADMPALIAAVRGTLSGLGQAAAPASEAEKLTPPVPIRKSVTEDYIVNLETGQHFRTLKKHLSLLGLKPARYREKGGLPHDCPMVAPAYAAQRSTLAKEFGLGNRRKA